MSDARMTFTDESGLEFQWHGGEYIDVGYTAGEDSAIRNSEGVPSHEAGDFVASDVINVWDSAGGFPTIQSLSGFEAKCREYAAEQVASTS